MKRFLFIASLLLGTFFAKAQPVSNEVLWADSVMQQLDTNARIAQLFMIDAFSVKEPEHFALVERMIVHYKIGGLIFFKGTPSAQARLTNYYQSLSKVPLLIGIDGEWGLSMRLDSTTQFPYQLALGGIPYDTMIYRMGREIARQCKRMGIHINFAPVVDINNNPNNPVISYRSFGENKYRVAALGYQYMKGLQDGGIMACAKHFPGHGDTETDSHLDIPLIRASRSRLDTLELYPFRYLADRGLKSIMAAHLYVPALDSTVNRASSLSPKIIDTLLHQQMGFKGLVFTDALNMKGVAKYFMPGDLEIEALKAGNDVLLYSENVPLAIFRIRQALDSGKLSMDMVNEKVYHILLEKYRAGLNNPQVVDTANLYAELNPISTQILLRHLVQNELVLVKNEDELVPFHNEHQRKIAAVAVGATDKNTFQQMLGQHGRFDYFQIDKMAGMGAFDTLLGKLKDYKTVVLSLHQTSKMVTRNYGVTEPAKIFINKLNKQNRTIFFNFGSPYSLKYFPGFKTVFIGYEDNTLTQENAAQALFGALPVSGHIAVGVEKDYPYHSGNELAPNGTLLRTLPEEKGISSRSFDRIDSIVSHAIADSATPGCQVMVVKDGQVLYQKSFGKLSYDSASANVRNDHLYDLASVTKVAATTLAVMKLYEEGKIKLDAPVSQYLKDLRKTNKKTITIKELLLHQSGMQPYIPFYRSTLDSNTYSRLYDSVESDKFPVQVASRMFLRKNYDDSIWNIIRSSPLRRRGEYVYSDLNFMVLQRIVEKLSGKTLDEYVEEEFYGPMNIPSLMFHPLQKTNALEIAPTENDTLWRRQVVRGYVHDQGAAMLGGVCGHAGLFGTANDLAILMQMLLNNGEYAGKRYLDSATVALFTSVQSSTSRRGLGFDKPELDPGKSSPTSTLASPRCYGHTGFTGTCVWVDPAYKLVYVFLSNRVYPDAENKKLVKQNVRTEIQEAIYETVR